MRDYSSGSSGGAPTKEMTPEIKERLDELRTMIDDEVDLSYGELAELQSYGPYIAEGDLDLLQWAGVKEYEDSDD